MGASHAARYKPPITGASRSAPVNAPTAPVKPESAVLPTAPALSTRLAFGSSSAENKPGNSSGSDWVSAGSVGLVMSEMALANPPIMGARVGSCGEINSAKPPIMGTSPGATCGCKLVGCCIGMVCGCAGWFGAPIPASAPASPKGLFTSKFSVGVLV